MDQILKLARHAEALRRLDEITDHLALLGQGELPEAARREMQRLADRFAEASEQLGALLAEEEAEEAS